MWRVNNAHKAISIPRKVLQVVLHARISSISLREVGLCMDNGYYDYTEVFVNFQMYTYENSDLL